MYALMQQLCGSDFDAETDPSDKIGNIRKLLAGLQSVADATHMFENDALNLSTVVDAEAIANDSDEGALVTVLELCLVAGLESPHKETVVHNIMGLEESAQHQVMYLINDTMTRYKASAHSRDLSLDVSFSSAVGSAPASPTKRNTETETHLREQLDLAQSSNTQLRERADDLSAQNRELKQNLVAAQDSLQELQIQMKSDIDTAVLKVKKETSEEIKSIQSRASKQEATQQMLLDDANRQLADTEAQLAAARSSHESKIHDLEEQVSHLQEQAHVAEATAAKLAKTETAVERYRSKLAEFGNLQMRLDEAESQRDDLIERIATLEHEADQASTLKQQVKQLKQQLADSETATEQARHELESAENQMATLREIAADERNAAQHAKEDAKRLQVQLDAAKASGPSMSSSSSLGAQLNASDDADSNIDAARLRVEVEHLKQQLQSAATQEDVDFLQAKYTKSEAKVTDMKKQYAELQKKYMKLEHSAAASTTSAVPAASASASQVDAAEVAQLKKTVQTLQLRNERLQQKVFTLSNPTDTAASSPAPSPGPSPVKGAPSEDRKRLKQLHGKYQASVKQSREAIVARDKHIKVLEAKLRETVTRADSAARASRDKDDEIAAIKRMRAESRDMARREQQLMSSAFYQLGTELALRVHNPTAASVKSGAPTRLSWLEQQRKRRVP
jgi:myosin heavy subunit